jgi:hypothetical protein
VLRLQAQLTGNDGVLGLDCLLASIHQLNLDRVGIRETDKTKFKPNAISSNPEI